MYSSKIFEIFKNPTNAGGLQGSNGIGKYVDGECGDVVKIYLKIDENSKIIDARFKTMGAVGTIVASSALCSIVVGLNTNEARNVKAGDVLEITGAYPTDKLYTVDFAVKGLNLALDNYIEKLEKEENSTKKQKKTTKKVEVEEKEDAEEITATGTQEDLFGKYFQDEKVSNQVAVNRAKEAREYTPVVETKILTDEELKKLLEEKVAKSKNVENDKTISKAKAMFDAMFEE